MTYGTNIQLYKEMYNDYIKNDLNLISKTLWQKEPTPLTILEYYSELGSRIKSQSKDITNVNHDNKKSNINDRKKGNEIIPIDAVYEAKQLLRSTNYYEHQFGLMSYIQNRKNDRDFLFILRICYDICLERTYKI